MAKNNNAKLSSNGTNEESNSKLSSNETNEETNVDRQVALTTFDNPFDPFEQFDNWFQYDIEKGYNSCAYLARIARTSDQLSDKENDEEIERAIDEIVRYDFMNIYLKVERVRKVGENA